MITVALGGISRTVNNIKIEIVTKPHANRLVKRYQGGRLERVTKVAKNTDTPLVITVDVVIVEIILARGKKDL